MKKTAAKLINSHLYSKILATEFINKLHSHDKCQKTIHFSVPTALVIQRKFVTLQNNAEMPHQGKQEQNKN